MGNQSKGYGYPAQKRRWYNETKVRVMQYDVIVIGELNADLILNNILEFPSVGKEIIAGQMNLTLGSSSAIFASNLSTLGARVRFSGNVGKDDFGKFCIDSLKSKNVDTALINLDDENGTGLTVVMNYGEDRAMVTYQGAMKSFTANDIDQGDLKSARHLHFSSYFLQPGMAPGLPDLFKKAKELGLTVSFDPQWDPEERWELDLKAILPFIDVFLPNKKEFAALTGSDNWEKSLYELRDYSNIIAIKDGNNGSYVFYKNNIKHCRPFLNDRVVDSIGAGDSFNAGFIYQFVNGLPIEKCQEYANLIGAVSTTAGGGTGAFKSRKSAEEIAKKRFNYDLKIT
jgi:sugar/nucleoside kinase (ribokinase family)